MGAARASDERRHGLWGGEASVLVPQKVRLTRIAPNAYILRSDGTSVQVRINRGAIPAKYRSASTDRIGREARTRLRKNGYRIESYRRAGKMVDITFSGSEKKTMQTQIGPVVVKVLWDGELRWFRQTNHRTYESVVIVPEPESRKVAAVTLKRAAASLRIPSMRRQPLDRFRDTASALPLVWSRAASWLPGWGTK